MPAFHHCILSLPAFCPRAEKKVFVKKYKSITDSKSSPGFKYPFSQKRYYPEIFNLSRLVLWSRLLPFIMAAKINTEDVGRAWIIITEALSSKNASVRVILVEKNMVNTSMCINIIYLSVSTSTFSLNLVFIINTKNYFTDK